MKHQFTPSKIAHISKVGDDHPDFHEVKQYKLALAHRITKFNISPKQVIVSKKIAYLFRE
jgi:hypothetical protein